ncbi:MAG: HD domain-containing protein [Endomicrobium sp.]|jgi:metal-dependent HD superfamily phosphatase/phosphodiesterase|uniref:HD domain-containing protein n=1 Tax=Candidatus Endomicrobiellum cubanum TaxID=3242325 RepID=UPI00281C3070|nr:HD domain-containing protein [Endomicrobium sp.]
MNEILTFEGIRNNPEIQTYFEFTDNAFAVMGYKEHGHGHALRSAETAENILKSLGYNQREQELAKIAAYLHDIGNTVSIHSHDQSSAVMFLNIVGESLYGDEVFAIATAIGGHEDKNVDPVSTMAAALVLGDKTDVRRERIRTKNMFLIDKHSLVIAACRKAEVIVDKKESVIKLKIDIDTSICSVMDYFEIFMSRTIYCKRAANVLKCDLELYINEDKFL